MYNKSNKNSRLINLLVGIIAVFIIIFLIVFLVNRSNNNNSTVKEQQFTENLNSMHQTAKEFFAGQLPEDKNGSLQTTLQELYEMGAIDQLEYGNEACNTEESYISITKISDDEYRVKSNLVCGDKSDSTVEKIKSSTTVKDKDGNTIIDEEKDDVKLDVEKNPSKDDNSSKDNNKNDNDTVYCNDFKCTVSEIPTTCTVTYEYEHVKRSVSCPNGYNISGSTCVMESGDTKSPTPIYSQPTTKVESAKVNKGEPYKVYVNPTTNTTDGYYTCSEGTLDGNKCIVSESKIVTYESTCPYGYNRVGNYCYKYANKSSGSTTSTCPAGYTDNGTNCYIRTAVNSSTTTSCPSGYTKSGNYCYKYANKTTTSTQTCPSGYQRNGNYCYKFANKTTSSTKTCPAGTTPSNGMCVKQVSAVKSYSAWGNPVSTYSTSSRESTYTNELEKKVLLGSTTIGKSTVYNYAIYRRTTHYTCSQGTLSGNVCLVYSNPTTTNTAVCPAGYTDNGTNCYISQAINTSTTATCPAGYTDNGSNCYIRTAVNTSTNTSCPSGYTKSGNYCYKYANKTTSTTPGSCPAGYTDGGSTCYIKVETGIQLKEICPSGYTDNGTKCTKRVSARYVSGSTYYSCPTGYTQSGSGANTKCYKFETSDEQYYCENAKAELKGQLCYIKEDAKFLENQCPSGYTLGADNLCHKSNIVTTNPIWTDVDYIYSKDKYVPGYQRTGRGKFHQVCVRIDGSTDHKVWK